MLQVKLLQTVTSLVKLAIFMGTIYVFTLKRIHNGCAYLFNDEIHALMYRFTDSHKLLETKSDARLLFNMVNDSPFILIVHLDSCSVPVSTMLILIPDCSPLKLLNG